MNAILYLDNPHKPINGTMFYCFEYFVFLKQYCPNLKFIHLNSSQETVDRFKAIFRDKYVFDHSILDDVVGLGRIQMMQQLLQNIMIFDVRTYINAKDYFGKAKSVRVYCNKEEGIPYLNYRPTHTFYGWYDQYQVYNVKNRLKLYKDIHKTFAERGTKTLISSPNGDNNAIVATLGLDPATVLLKEPKVHYTGLFEQLEKIVYYHSGNNDANNRILVEAVIHNMPIDVHINGHVSDSVFERHTVIQNADVDQLLLTKEDTMIQDFLRDC